MYVIENNTYERERERERFYLLVCAPSNVGARLPDFSWYNIPQHTKTGKSIPNDHKIYQIVVEYSKWQ
jgi:hypothetical protein